MKPKALIRPFKSVDWPIFSAMFRAAFIEDPFFPDMERRIQLAQLAHSFGMKRLVGEVHVLEEAQGVAGFLILRQRRCKELHLHYMATAPEHRRKGFGRLLLNFSREAAKNRNSRLRLETVADSVAAKLYLAEGFSIEKQWNSYLWVQKKDVRNGQGQLELYCWPTWRETLSFNVLGKKLDAIGLSIKRLVKRPVQLCKESILRTTHYSIMGVEGNKIVAIFQLSFYADFSRGVGHFAASAVQDTLLANALARLPAWKSRWPSDFRLITSNPINSVVLESAGYQPGPTYIGMVKE